MRWRLRSRRKGAQSAAGIADRRTNCTQQRKQDNEQQASYAKDYFAKVEAELQKIYDGILALMDKNLIPSARRTAGAEGHQQKNAQELIQFERVDLNRFQGSDRPAM